MRPLGSRGLNELFDQAVKLGPIRELVVSRGIDRPPSLPGDALHDKANYEVVDRAVARRDHSASAVSRVFPVARWLAAGLGVAVSSWAAYAAFTWIRYGRQRRRFAPEESDFLLDRFMPEFEVAERHSIRVNAPAEITFETAATLNLTQSRTIRGLFKAREFMLGGQHSQPVLPKPLLSWAEALGWGVLVTNPGREVVIGAVTRPWEPKVVFRPLRPDEFTDFNEPGCVKIVWTLRSDPVSATQSIARTDTRVIATDPGARAKFRLYWAFLSPGIRLIRRVALAMVKKEAERAASRTLPTSSPI